MTTLSGVVRGLSKIREAAPELPLGGLVAFLAVAGKDDKLEDKPMLKEVAAEIGIPYTSALRHLLLLSMTKEPGVDGLGWIETYTWPLDRRQKYAKLTPKGREIVSDLMRTLSR